MGGWTKQNMKRNMKEGKEEAKWAETQRRRMGGDRRKPIIGRGLVVVETRGSRSASTWSSRPGGVAVLDFQSPFALSLSLSLSLDLSW